MREIKLANKRRVALVDDEDESLVEEHNWYTDGNGYAQTHIACKETKTGKTTIAMHRLVMGLKRNDGKEVDHADGNILNNQKSNLRICTSTQNHWNASRPKDNKSGYKGVSHHTQYGKWRAVIQVHGKHIHIGYFKDKHTAARAYNTVAKEHFGEFAKLNVIEKEAT